jgi:hypothetical protein
MGCATSNASEPIIGCWQRENEAYALVFDEHGHGSFELSNAAAEAPISYVFPRVRWSKRGDGYVLRFTATSLRGAYNVRAHLNDSQILIDGEVPLERVSAADCRARH